MRMAQSRGPDYYPQYLLEDPHDELGIRHGRWEIDICDPRAWLPMTCGLPCAMPCLATAQMHARLSLRRYGLALVIELTNAVAIAGLPVAGYMALLNLQSVSNGPMHTTLWMLLLWTALLGPVILLFAMALALADLRWKIRVRYQVPGSRGRDLCVVTCLPICAIAQMSTHLRCLRPGRYSLAHAAAVRVLGVAVY
jgi:Cys-rich protein (TIGR01571 family)